MRRTRGVMAVVACLLLLTLAPIATAKPGNGVDRAPQVDLQILAFNDFHGQLGPYYPNVGGAAYLATYLRDLEATTRNTVIVSGGDLIGASPLTSALFHDEPTIEAANLMGVDVAVVGNHEFDEGWEELLRMQSGGCHPVDGCLDGDGFDGADFPFLAANVVREDTGRTLFPPYKVMTFNGVRVAFIGVVLEGTPSIVTASATEGLEFLDEADTINAWVQYLKKRRIETFVAIVHQGGSSSCTGAIADIVDQTNDEVDLFITGHTHNTYVCDIDGRTVTGTRNGGRVFTEIHLTLNKVTKEVVSVTAVNHDVWTADVTPAADVTALVAEYEALAAPLANQVIGSVTADITTTANAAGESALGDVIADAQLAATSAVVAFMNPGGIRTHILYGEISGSELPGEVTYGEAFKVQPFANYLTTMTLTGAQIDALLEQQFVAGRMLQVSDGFTYTWSSSAPVGSKVDPASIMIGGVPIDLGADYRVTMNSFLADGGDGFTVFTQGTDRITGIVDVDALADYLGASSPVAPGPQDRITMAP
ncbi:MAG: bifunctional metallophosphatase/5'-nucleotidase [Actinobacteria bacterium]|nr:bifunctional metallophosphatase/5'-nucleotidase [Actinomycetota bacterium]MBU1493756.1 bifunctional metallophosphatase/5'-nucleotidase [Actinomycetota bacterium]MBU1866066.1 bifunctional metallophosphatase/5'-nucleotidase [Actinomycetota bacterium]